MILEVSTISFEREKRVRSWKLWFQRIRFFVGIPSPGISPNSFEELTYTVKDKMNRRRRRCIDISMGIEVKSAEDWGNAK